MDIIVFIFIFVCEGECPPHLSESTAEDDDEIRSDRLHFAIFISLQSMRVTEEARAYPFSLVKA
jgi:hypothetical protein